MIISETYPICENEILLFHSRFRILKLQKQSLSIMRHAICYARIRRLRNSTSSTTVLRVEFHEIEYLCVPGHRQICTTINILLLLDWTLDDPDVCPPLRTSLHTEWLVVSPFWQPPSRDKSSLYPETLDTLRNMHLVDIDDPLFIVHRSHFFELTHRYGSIHVHRWRR